MSDRLSVISIQQRSYRYSSILHYRRIRLWWTLCLLNVFLHFVSAMAQPQVVSFKKLQQFLPQDSLGKYLPDKPTGETSTMMGFSTSWARVNYRSTIDSSVLSTKITDLLNIPSYMSIVPSMNGDSVHSAPSGYEKLVSYRDLKVVETYDSVNHQVKLQTYYANRFLLEINGTGISNPSILYELLDKINFEGLKGLIKI